MRNQELFVNLRACCRAAPVVLVVGLLVLGFTTGHGTHAMAGLEDGSMLSVDRHCAQVSCFWCMPDSGCTIMSPTTIRHTRLEPLLFASSTYLPPTDPPPRPAA